MMPVPRKVLPIINLFRHKPVLALFEVNLQCNSGCGYCSLPLNQGRYEMSRAEIRRVFDGLYRDGLRYVFLQGGEPTLREDLLEIIADLHEIGFTQTLVSNGTRMSEAFIDRLRNMPVNVTISLDSLDRARYQRIRGQDQLKNVLAAVNRLADYPHPKYLACVVSEQNRDEVMDLLRFAREHGFIPTVTPYHWKVGRYGREDPGLQYQRESLVPVFREVLASGLAQEGYLSHHVRDSIRWLQGKKLEACDAGQFSIAIDASGNVAPCQAQQAAGNLLQEPLAQILGRMDREAVRQCSNASGCNLICNRIVGSNLRHPIKAARSPNLFRHVSL